MWPGCCPSPSSSSFCAKEHCNPRRRQLLHGDPPWHRIFCFRHPVHANFIRAGSTSPCVVRICRRSVSLETGISIIGFYFPILGNNLNTLTYGQIAGGKLCTWIPGLGNGAPRGDAGALFAGSWRCTAGNDMKMVLNSSYRLLGYFWSMKDWKVSHVGEFVKH